MSSDERRHAMEEKTFAVLTAESVNVIAESVGLQQIPHEAASALGEDASYRMRQLVMLATQYMKHSKRRRLTTEDLNKAAQVMGLMPVLGHGSQEPVTFRHVKDADVHCVDDPETSLSDIALGSYIPKQIGQPSIKAHWLAVEGTMKMASTNTSGKGQEMSATHLKYYNMMTKALLGTGVEAKKKALQDLRTNPNLVPVLPYLINFVVSGIKNMSHDIGQLTTLLNTVRALLHNRSLYLMNKPYLNTIVKGVEFCVLETLAASISSVNDHWILRDFAARLLAEIVNRWNSPQNHLRHSTIKLMKEVLQDTTKSFYSHYGAIMSLIALGHNAIEDVIMPHLPTYWPHLQAAMDDRSPEHLVTKLDSQKVFGALRIAAEKIMRRHIKRFEELAQQNGDKKETTAASTTAGSSGVIKLEHIKAEGDVDGASSELNIFQMYSMLHEYFGDSISHCLPVVESSKSVFVPSPKDDLVSLGDENSGKSGEELLENLMEQIKLQEKLEKERKEKEEQERKEREKRDRERRARRLLEQKKREEEERKQRQKREEEDQRRRQRLEALGEERQRKWREEEERRQKDWEEQFKELNRNRSKPEWQQQIELRKIQLEEEIQYSRMIEASKRKEGGRERARREEEEEKVRKRQEEEEMLRRKEEEDEQAGVGRIGLRRRKPVNYSEKDDEDLNDLLGNSKLGAKKRKTSSSSSGHHHPQGQTPHHYPQQFGGLKLPHHSDISDDSDSSDLGRRLAAGLMSPASAAAAAEAIAVSKLIDPSKGLLKLKIKRQSGHGTGTPPHPMSSSSSTPQHTPTAAASASYHSPSMLSPMYSPHSGTSVPTPPGPSMADNIAGSSSAHQRNKSSSGAEKEPKQKKTGGSGSVSSIHSRAGSTGIQDISDPEEPFTMDPPHQLSSSGGLLNPMMYSPGGESSGSDSNPHRKALKLKLKLTPKDSASD